MNIVEKITISNPIYSLMNVEFQNKIEKNQSIIFIKEINMGIKTQQEEGTRISFSHSNINISTST